MIPFLASSIFSPTCFYHVINQAKPVKSQYLNDVCIQLNYFQGILTCVTNEVILTQTEYNPPFRYNYECSSSIIKSYSTIYITMAALLLVNQTTVMFIIRMFYRFVNKKSKLFKIMDSMIPTKIKPNQSAERESQISNLNFISDDNVPFNRSIFIINVFSFLSLILTCGIVVPPVGIILTGSLYFYIHITNSYMGKKFDDKLSTISETNILPGLNKKEWIILIFSYEKILENIEQNLNQCLFLFLLPTMSIFYTVLLFDILGNNANFEISVNKFYFF